MAHDQLSPKQNGSLKPSPLTPTWSNMSHTFPIVEGSEVHSIYTDFSKAFETVDHGLLISKLGSLGVDRNIISWVKSYLWHRTVYVAFNWHKSSLFIPTSGVPQGSVLGPLLINIFINDLCQLLKCPFLLFADDLKIFIKIKSRADLIKLQNDIDRLFRWSTENKLKLYIDKCQSMVFSNKVLWCHPHHE